MTRLPCNCLIWLQYFSQTIEALVSLWPQCKTVHGKARLSSLSLSLSLSLSSQPNVVSPRHSQSQGAVERSNRDVEDILKAWKKDTKSNSWASALPIVQYTKNARCISHFHLFLFYVFLPSFLSSFISSFHPALPLPDSLSAGTTVASADLPSWPCSAGSQLWGLSTWAWPGP